VHGYSISFGYGTDVRVLVSDNQHPGSNNDSMKDDANASFSLVAVSASTLLVVQQEGHQVHKIP